MNFLNLCIFISSISFFGYVISYFTSSHMKKEFERFGLEKIGLFTIVLEFLGAAGLIVGLMYNSILLIASLGLSLLMLAGLLVRIRLKDNIRISLPAFFYMGLNTYIFIESIN